jgi:hypothetical protein
MVVKLAFWHVQFNKVLETKKLVAMLIKLSQPGIEAKSVFKKLELLKSQIELQW